MITVASIQRALAQVNESFQAACKFEEGKAIDEARFHYSLALAVLNVLLASSADELFRVRTWLPRVHERIGRIDLARLNTSEAAHHLAAARVGYDALGYGGINSFAVSVLLAEAHVRSGNAEAGKAAARLATEALELVEDYCSPSAVYAYYWLYRCELMLGNPEAATVAAGRMVALLDGNPDVINSGTASLLRRELASGSVA